MIGKSLGRYHIRDQLGEGGMATVYKAFDTRLEREVALKVILPHRRHAPEFLKRFDREAKALAKMSHPNVVRVLDYGEQDGLPYLVMEYTPGGTLKEKLGEAIPWHKAVHMLRPIAQALAYAHERKIIHRDVKPSNIIFSELGEPMLSDFGIAKVLETEKTWDVTGTGVGIGTPEYMAPEQGIGKGVDHRADVYALGVVFYEMITGRTPYQADTPLAVLMKHINDPLPHPSEIVASLPERVEQVIIKALAKEAEDRYRSMGEFVAALTNLVERADVTVKEVVQVPDKKRPRPAVLVGLAALAVVVMVGLIWGIRTLPGISDQAFQSSVVVPEVEEVTETLDLTRAVGVVQAITQTARAHVNATATQAIHNARLTGTAISLMPTKEASIGPTLTSEFITDSGLVIYDDFDSGDEYINPRRWSGFYQKFHIEDGAAVFRAQKGEMSTFGTDLLPNQAWTPSSSGMVRFSVETKIRLGSSIRGSNRWASAAIQLTGPLIPSGGYWWFAFGYKYQPGFFSFSCGGSRGDGQEEFYSHDVGNPEFDTWHTFRISITEITNSDDLALVAYVDDEQICNYVPPPDWQRAIDVGGKVSFLIVNVWIDSWDLEKPFTTYFDDVAVGLGTDG